MGDATKHSIVAPSAAHRWLVCPPSAQLNAEYGKHETSVYAEEGSLAHRIAELALLDTLHERTTGNARAKAFEEFEECRKNPLYKPEMIDEVGKYLDHVNGLMAASGKGARMYVEMPVPLFYRPTDKGTIDNVITGGADNTLYVTDLKYGKGVRVEAEGNKQLIIYAISALDALDIAGITLGADVKRVVLTIVQPRLDHIATWTLSLDGLLAHRKYITEVADTALLGEGELKAGEHCRFCAVKPRCRALKALSETFAEQSFDDPRLLTDAEIARLLGSVDTLADWIASLKKHALERAVAGVRFDGYKLVAGVTRRQITDEKAIYNGLVAAGYEPDLLRRSTFITLGELEKMVDKADFATLCAPWIKKPEAAPVLAEASDPRAEFGLAKANEDFAEYLK